MKKFICLTFFALMAGYPPSGRAWTWNAMNSNPTQASILFPGTQLTDFGYSLRMESNGNLTFSQGDQTLLWQSGTSAGRGYAILQIDGNFVIYDSSDHGWDQPLAARGAGPEDHNEVVVVNGSFLQASWNDSISVVLWRQGPAFEAPYTSGVTEWGNPVRYHVSAWPGIEDVSDPAQVQTFYVHYWIPWKDPPPPLKTDEGAWFWSLYEHGIECARICTWDPSCESFVFGAYWAYISERNDSMPLCSLSMETLNMHHEVPWYYGSMSGQKYW